MSEDKKVRFKKRFIFLGILGLIVTLIVFDRIDYKRFLEGEIETQRVHESVLHEADSAIIVLDNANNLIDSLKIQDQIVKTELDSLNDNLKNKKITLAEYTKKLEKLLIESEESKKLAELNGKLAEEHRKIADEVSKKARQQQMFSERAKKISERQYDELKLNYNNLLNEYKKLASSVDSINISIVNDSIMNNNPIENDNIKDSKTTIKTTKMPNTKKSVKYKSSGGKKRGRGKKF